MEAINLMNARKAAGPSGWDILSVKDMWEESVKKLVKVANDILEERCSKVGERAS